jgi:hypothetical protein
VFAALKASLLLGVVLLGCVYSRCAGCMRVLFAGAELQCVHIRLHRMQFCVESGSLSSEPHCGILSLFAYLRISCGVAGHDQSQCGTGSAAIAC